MYLSACVRRLGYLATCFLGTYTSRYTYLLSIDIETDVVTARTVKANQIPAFPVYYAEVLSWRRELQTIRTGLTYLNLQP